MQHCFYMIPFNFRYTSLSKICSALLTTPTEEVSIGIEGQETFYKVGPRFANNNIYFYFQGALIKTCTSLRSLTTWITDPYDVYAQVIAQKFLHRIYVHYNILFNAYESILYYEDLPKDRITVKKYCEFGKLARPVVNWQQEGF